MICPVSGAIKISRTNSMLLSEVLSKSPLQPRAHRQKRPVGQLKHLNQAGKARNSAKQRPRRWQNAPKTRKASSTTEHLAS
jgi:hypothetical protein